MSFALSSTSLLGCLIAVVCVDSARADVHVVAPSGGDFTQPQAAVDAAVDGDIVLIRSGTYGPSLYVSAKSLTIIADAGADVFIDGDVSIDGLSSAQSVSMQRVRMRVFNVNACAGPVRIVGCTVPLQIHDTIPFPVGGTYVNSSGNVVFSGCDLNGVTTTSTAYHEPLAALHVIDSTVLLTDSTARGGDGPAGGLNIPGLAGADAVECSNATLRLAGTTCRGGAGGAGWDGACGPPAYPPSNGGWGGSGVTGNGVSFTVLDSTLLGGAGAPGGSNPCASATDGGDGVPYGFAGTTTFVAGSHRKLAAMQPAREGGSLLMHFQGQPGDRVFLSSSPTAAWSEQPILHGVLLVSPPYRRRLMGTADGSGVLDVAIAVTELGPGIEGATLQMQVVAVDVADERWVTGATAAVRLDSGF